MKILDWSPNDDLYLKPGEVEIHNKYHAEIAGVIDKDAILGARKRIERIDYLKKALELADTQIHGSVLEVGAGDGWCSAYMLMNYPIDEMYIMEVDRPALDKLIPHTLAQLGVNDEKVKYVLGSFNQIKIESKLDFVIAMGALHHSNNLFQTFRSIYNSLKPGGWVIAQEPFMIDSTKNTYYFNRDEQSINFKGLINIRNDQRTDIFYRACEYQTAALHAGFDYQSFKFNDDDLQKREKPLKSIFNFFKTRIKNTNENSSNKLVERPKNFVVYAQKPEVNYSKLPTTAWEY